MNIARRGVILASILLAGGVIGGVVGPAAAADFWGPYGASYGQTYHGRGSVDPTNKWARSETDSLVGSVPAGYLGADARLFSTATGSLCKGSGWLYNTVSGTGYIVHTPYTSNCDNAYFYAYSVSEGYSSSFGTYASSYDPYSPNEFF